MSIARRTRPVAALAALAIVAVLAACTPSANRNEEITATFAFVRAGYTNQVVSCAEAAKTRTLAPGKTRHTTRCTHVNGATVTLISTYVDDYATVAAELRHRVKGVKVVHGCSFTKRGNSWAVVDANNCIVGA